MRLALSILALALPAFATERFCSPSGSGNGTLASPWSLASCLTDSNISDGDIIYLRGGTYAGNFVSNLVGTTGAGRITVQNYPGEVAILTDSTCIGSVENLSVTGDFTDYKATQLGYFQFQNTCAVRTYSADFRPNGIEIQPGADSNRFFELVVHDTGIGIVNAGASNEFRGNLIYNNGKINTTADRQNGHGIYPSTTTATTIFDNWILNNYGFGVHAFGTTMTALDVEVNTIARNGLLSGVGVGPFSQIIADDTNQGNTGTHSVIGNKLYVPVSFTGHAAFADTNLCIGCSSGASAGQGGYTITGNYIVGGVPAISLQGPDTVTMTGNLVTSNNYVCTALTLVVWSPVNNNTYNGNRTANQNWNVGATDLTFTDWQGAPLNWDAAGAWNSAVPVSNQNYVTVSAHNAGLGAVTIFNWAGGNTATVDISAAATAGRYVEIYNAQNYPAGPVFKGIYAGGNVTLPMNSASANPVGDTAVAADVAFGSFVLQSAVPTFRKQSQ